MLIGYSKLGLAGAYLFVGKMGHIAIVGWFEPIYNIYFRESLGYGFTSKAVFTIPKYLVY